MGIARPVYDDIRLKECYGNISQKANNFSNPTPLQFTIAFFTLFIDDCFRHYHNLNAGITQWCISCEHEITTKPDS